jgi:3-methyladenine DNA glycosylase AlkC
MVNSDKTNLLTELKQLKELFNRKVGSCKAKNDFSKRLSDFLSILIEEANTEIKELEELSKQIDDLEKKLG